MKTAIKVEWKFAVLLAAFSYSRWAHAQQPCTDGVRVEGSVTDSTGAFIPRAMVRTPDNQTIAADGQGRFVIDCASPGTVLTIEAEGFSATSKTLTGTPGRTAQIAVALTVAAVETDVQVGDDATAMDADHGAGTRNLSGREVQELADDPDDFLRELQALSAGGGGMPGAATITVDGFQNASALPPKGSISSIRINPDMFSPEYERAPYLGGRVEIFTKPGADKFHGALFFTDSDGSFNATNPFSVSATPAGKRRYGFELNGPVLRKRSDFMLALEKRDIDEFNVVNAITLDANHQRAAFRQTVAAPQRLWVASARNGWQLTANDIATISFSANVNNFGNQGVGGLTLAEAGYSSKVSEYDLRLNNVMTLTPNVLHESRIGYSWKETEQTPNSTMPSLQVAGYFNGGGATSQHLRNRERDLEVDDDVIITHGIHSLKFGVQTLGLFLHDYDPDTFNGAYTFGVGTGPTLDSNNNPTSGTTTIDALEQYRRALLGLPGGTPISYQQTSGNPLVPLTQWRVALYAQDAVKLAPGFTLTTGLRYQVQTTPGSLKNFSPRVGLAWSPDKKSTWVVHLRGGLFHDPNVQAYATEVYRLDGVRQRMTTVYSPKFGDPLSQAPGSIAVSTIKTFPRSLEQFTSLQTHVSVEHTLPRGWHAAATFYWAENWGSLRVKNINAPMVPSSIGTAPDPTAALSAPRPITPNENILQYQNSGHLAGNILVTGADHSSGKRFNFSAYYVHVNLKSDTNNAVASPQSTYSEAGESSKNDGTSLNSVYASGLVHLPWKIDMSAILDALSGQPYNVTSGTDANGDGNFNDRPSFASSPGSGVYSTPFGLLTTNTVNGDVPRNFGTTPARLHLDANLSRSFKLNPKDKNHPLSLAFNVRSANIVNHTNITTVGTVVSASNFSKPLAAETARRLEMGVRLTF